MDGGRGAALLLTRDDILGSIELRLHGIRNKGHSSGRYAHQVKPILKGAHGRDKQNVAEVCGSIPNESPMEGLLSAGHRGRSRFCTEERYGTFAYGDLAEWIVSSGGV